jgi:hypothetical protein
LVVFCDDPRGVEEEVKCFGFKSQEIVFTMSYCGLRNI